jgi:hypothetical protein
VRIWGLDSRSHRRFPRETRNCWAQVQSPASTRRSPDWARVLPGNGNQRGRDADP